MKCYSLHGGELRIRSWLGKAGFLKSEVQFYSSNNREVHFIIDYTKKIARVKGHLKVENCCSVALFFVE